MHFCAFSALTCILYACEIARKNSPTFSPKEAVYRFIPVVSDSDLGVKRDEFHYIIQGFSEVVITRW